MGIASMYSVRQMKALKQQQYRELLVNQYKLGNVIRVQTLASLNKNNGFQHTDQCMIIYVI